MKWLLAAVAFAMLIISAAHAGQSRRTVECRGVPSKLTGQAAGTGRRLDLDGRQS
jgi:hypothetical protein